MPGVVRRLDATFCDALVTFEKVYAAHVSLETIHRVFECRESHLSGSTEGNGKLG